MTLLELKPYDTVVLAFWTCVG